MANVHPLLFEVVVLFAFGEQFSRAINSQWKQGLPHLLLQLTFCSSPVRPFIHPVVPFVGLPIVLVGGFLCTILLPYILTSLTLHGQHFKYLLTLNGN